MSCARPCQGLKRWMTRGRAGARASPNGDANGVNGAPSAGSSARLRAEVLRDARARRMVQPDKQFRREPMRRLMAGVAVLLALAGAARAEETAKEKANKAAVLAFYDAALNQLDFDAASKYLGPVYKQHNPTAADGPEGLKGFIAYLKTTYPKTHSEVTMAFADGDYVILRVHAVRTPGTAGNAIVDIFRLEGGKVVEHWDSVQPVPDKAANGNGMF
jgi:predicted SnoaL-like aldol condensation-catalyzing enzyme